MKPGLAGIHLRMFGVTADVGIEREVVTLAASMERSDQSDVRPGKRAYSLENIQPSMPPDYTCFFPVPQP